MDQSFDVTTLVFAALAVFVVWKLRSVLGTRTGNERPPFDPFGIRRKMRDGAAPPATETGTVIRLPGADVRVASPPPPSFASPSWEGIVAPGSRAPDGLRMIAEADPSFDATAFVGGARAAYEMILAAFAAGDKQTLAPLLAKDVFDGFAAAIAAREAEGHKVESTFVGIDKALVEDAALRERTAQVSIRFQAKLITVTRDATGNVVDGSSDAVSDVNDLWTFARDIGSRDPNWKLVATETGA